MPDAKTDEPDQVLMNHPTVRFNNAKCATCGDERSRHKGHRGACSKCGKCEAFVAAK